MDGYWVGKLLFEANSDVTGRLVEAFRDDPDAVIARYPMSEGAARAVRDRDLRAIYELGVHPLLVRMGSHALYGPMSTPDYRDAIAGAVPRAY